VKSIPHYLRWYFFAFGRRLTVAKLRRVNVRNDGIADE
jgi:hypothetical protein